MVVVVEVAFPTVPPLAMGLLLFMRPRGAGFLGAVSASSSYSASAGRADER